MLFSLWNEVSFSRFALATYAWPSLTSGDSYISPVQASTWSPASTRAGGCWRMTSLKEVWNEILSKPGSFCVADWITEHPSLQDQLLDCPTRVWLQLSVPYWLTWSSWFSSSCLDHKKLFHLISITFSCFWQIFVALILVSHNPIITKCLKKILKWFNP